jgi:hypothetical protein
MNVEERARVDLPPYVPAEFEVFGRSLVFPRAIAQEGKLGFWRWLSMWLGIAGTYRKHETVDIVYESGGRRGVVTGLEPKPVD